jgi:PAS domain S-box-containing protein
MEPLAPDGELRSLESRLLASEAERLRLEDALSDILDAMSPHIALLDEHGVIRSVNASWKRFAIANGLQSQDFGVGQSYPGLCDSVAYDCADDVRKVAAGIRAVLDGHDIEASMEYPCHSPTQERWFRMSATPLRARDQAGSARGAIVMHLDISERKSGEMAALIEHTDAFVLVFDARGRIETVNPAFTRATGWTPLEASARTAAVWQLPLPMRVSEVIRAEQACRDGRRFLAEWSVTPITGRDGEVLSHLCIGRDIDRQQLIEKGLRENDKLRAVATLAGGIAHDFNNLLASILGLTELCELEAVDGSRQARNLTKIGEAGARAAALVRQMLDFSRQTPMAKSIMGFATLLGHSEGLLRAVAPAEIPLTLEVIEDGLVDVDPVQMEQVLLNLIRNAVHAMQGRDGYIRVVVDLAAPKTSRSGTEVPQYARLQVIDAGMGIPPHLLDKVLEPFFTTKAVGEGTGLGLAAVHGIVSNHEGVLEVDSELRVGTTVSVYLPLIKPGRA